MERAVVYKYDFGDHSASMSKTDKDKLPKFIKKDVAVGAVVKWLGIKVVNSHVWAWALVRYDSVVENRTFVMAPTGYKMDFAPEDLVHVGTFDETQWKHVWHVFEVKK